MSMPTLLTYFDGVEIELDQKVGQLESLDEETEIPTSLLKSGAAAGCCVSAGLLMRDTVSS